MHWLIQDKFNYDPAVRDLVANLKRLEINHSFVKAIPFSEDGLIADFDLDDIDEPIFTYGSYTLSKIVYNRGYRPGAFISPLISLNHLLDNYGDNMLNNDMRFFPLKEVIDNIGDEEFFVRPMEDTKSFTAEVTNKERFSDFVENIKGLGDGYSTVDMDTMVAISKPKSIQQEIRFFIVNGKISTYSTYKIGDRVCYDGFVDRDAIDFVSALVGFGNWNPDIAYVIDVAMSNDEPKILEVNSINSSGLYGIDTQKFIMSIEDLSRFEWRKEK